MLFLCVLGVRVTYMLVISWVIPFIPELLPSEARVLHRGVGQGSYINCSSPLMMKTGRVKHRHTGAVQHKSVFIFIFDFSGI